MTFSHALVLAVHFNTAMGSLARITLPDPSRVKADVLVVGCLEGEETKISSGPRDLSAAVRRLPRARRWRAERGRTLALDCEGLAEIRLVGLGYRNGVDLRGVAAFCDFVEKIAAETGARRIAVVLPRHPKVRAGAALVVSRLALLRYRFDSFRDSSAPDLPRSIQIFPAVADRPKFRAAAKHAKAVAGGAALARDLGNTPPNVANPAWMAARARSLARAVGAKARVLGRRELEKKAMGGILAVGGGSAAAPRLVRLEWGDRGPLVALVGKGVTFDTGGISIKPAAAMDEMKYDKCGACTVFGIVKAVAEIGLPVRLRAYLPLVENMPSGKAYRPGDIVRCYNGKTVEIINTDAEGRMILADSLAWAAEEGAEHIVEFSTLTGAAVVALGEHTAALYTPSDSLSKGLLDAAAGSGEQLWRMPLWPEFLEPMQGNHGDLVNQGGRWGGANNAAAFLGQFVGEHKSWAHIDIAGPAMRSTAPKGATGYGVAFTVGWLAGLCGAAA
ncbi:MAG: leucyl aminopeptidase [Acidobacteriota bacterium]|nr:leucyl aminopeptidase [Acidobacteriota bacterium]